MTTRRTHQGEMKLLGDPYVRQVIEYTLAYCMNKHDVELHAFITEGNHYHDVSTDPKAERPELLRDFHSFVARQLNRYYGTQDAFWSNKQTNVVDSETPDDVIRRIVYAMGNPVADGIEREGKNHSGIRYRWPQPDKVVKRPEGWWKSQDKGGTAPDELVLRFSRPPGFDELSDDELDGLIEERVLAYEKRKRDERDAEGKPFLCDVVKKSARGKSRAKTKRAKKSRDKKKRRMFSLAPSIGAKDKGHRLDAISRLKRFLSKYADARKRIAAGEVGILFPHGTYQARKRWNVPIESAPSLRCSLAPSRDCARGTISHPS